MQAHRRIALLVGCACLAGPATAQGAARGAALYLQLPGGQPSCVECHGPDPLANRNRLLTAAGGPNAIALAITKAAAMGYLGGLLDERDRSDLSAYLARVTAAEGASVVTWPRVLEFGRVARGAAVAEQPLRVLNAGSQAVAVQPVLVPAPGFSLHQARRRSPSRGRRAAVPWPGRGSRPSTRCCRACWCWLGWPCADARGRTRVVVSRGCHAAFTHLSQPAPSVRV